MKKILALLLSTLLLMSVASADPAVQAPPELHLVNDEITFLTSTGNYDWTYPTDTPDEWCGVEACGMAPTDPYVFENIEHLFLIEDTEFTLDWGDNSPDKVEVIGWENAVFQDVEHAGDYQDTYLELTDWKVVLKPDHGCFQNVAFEELHYRCERCALTVRLKHQTVLETRHTFCFQRVDGFLGYADFPRKGTHLVRHVRLPSTSFTSCWT